MPSHLASSEGITSVIPGLMSDSTTLTLAIGAIVAFFIFRKKGSLNLRGALIITGIFTLLDFILHELEFLIPATQSLPEFYFLFKVLVLPITLIVLVNRFKLKTIALCTVAALLLQIRYFTLGIYDLRTNIIMIVVHYFLILIAIMIATKFAKVKL